jgi:hypothetical protein
MITQKVTVTIKCETLSMDSINAILQQAISHIDSEIINGTLNADDGDCVQWSTTFENVEI